MRSPLGAAVILILFVAAGALRFSHATGDDLSASYVGCRLLAGGNAGHLYQHDAVDFSDVGTDAVWDAVADDADFRGTIHPYVQTPLWALSLRPLCTRSDFSGFEQVFAVAAMLCFAGSIWMVAVCWAPALLHPAAMALAVAILWFSVPFQYAMVLMQTHVIFFAMTIGALLLAEKCRPGWAGLLLAGAAAVKLTPGVLIVYWLLTRRWKAALSTVLWSGAIGCVTWLAVGRDLMGAYLAEIHRISQVLLLAMNNQSLAAWWMGWFYPAHALTETTMLPLPVAVRVGSLGLMVGFTCLGGWMDRDREGPPIGAMIGLIAATVFAPIAWTHYSIVLIAPLMVLWQVNRRQDRWVVWATISGILLLNYLPLAANVIRWQVGTPAIARSEFYAHVLCLGGLGFAAWQRRRGEGSATESEDVAGGVHKLPVAA